MLSSRNICATAAQLAAWITALNGIVIAANDLLFGIKSSLPAVSAVIATLFVVSGLFVGRVGTLLREVGSETPPGSRPYKALSKLMTLAFGLIALVMLGVLYALYDRISHGAAIFG